MEKYDPIRILGEGSFGKVYLMRDKVNRKFVCVKVIKIKNIPKKEREATKIEVDLLRRLHHPNIVRYIDSFLSKNNESLCICMEYCDGGDLASQIKAARRKLFSEDKILHWFVQIALGLQYMHANKVLHRDLKTQNIFLLGNGRLVLGDLGISKVLEGTMDFAQTCIGTPYYMSPEIFKNKPYSYKSDVWALGCVLYEMTTLDHAFDANSLNGLAQKIIKGRYPPVHAKYSRHLRDLIGQLLSTNPQQRPDLDQILRKPFVKKHIINFFQDIASRPSNSLGEGTMIVRAAAGGGFSNGALGTDQNMISFRRQLEELDMAREVAMALDSKGAEVPSDPLEAKRMAKEQVSALRREEDHKRMVEFALEKLRKEKEMRLKQVSGGPTGGPSAPSARMGVVGKDGKAQAVAAGIAVIPSKLSKPAANRQPQRVPPNVPPLAEMKKDGVREGGGLNGLPSRSRQHSVDYMAKDGEEKSARRIAEEKRREVEERKQREDVRAEAKAREEARLKEEALIREEELAKQRRDQLRAQQQQQEMALKREQNRDKERERQREEIEQLRRDKMELDRRTKERDRLREERREMERKKLDDARERERGDSSLDDEKPLTSARSDIDRGDKSSGLSAKDRVLLAKQERLAREETERIEAFRNAEQQNRIAREQAAVLARKQFHPNDAAAALRLQLLQEEDTKRASVAKNVDLSELGDRLHEVAGNSRFGSKAEAPVHSARSASAVDADDGSGADTASDDETESSSVWNDNGAYNPEEEEEDIRNKEEELRMELNLASRRVEELKKTLKETKSFLDARGLSIAHGSIVRSKVPAASTIASADEEEEEDDEFDVGEDESQDYEDDETDDGYVIQSQPSTQSSRNMTPPAPVKPSPYQNLADPPSPSGRLGDRIKHLRTRCRDALGRESFERAYMYLKLRNEGSGDERGQYDDDDDTEKIAHMRDILGEGKAHFMPLIEQLIFMEETHNAT